MGLFGDDSSNNRGQSLEANARGESVTVDRLTKTSGGVMQNDFFDREPALAYLKQDEQPHFFFYNDTKGITRSGTTVGDNATNSYSNLCLITDERVLFFVAGSKGEAIPLQSITDVETSSGHLKHRLTFWTADHEYTFYVSNSIDGEEVHAGGNYIDYVNSQTESTEGSVQSKESTVVEGLSTIWDEQLDETPVADDALAAEPQGSYVTEARYKKVEGILDPDETVHFITRGSTVDVEGSSAGQSLFGDDRSRKSGTRGWVRAVITNKRVAIKIPQMLGTDERSVPYNSITSVDLDTGLVTKRLSLQTAGQTYHIEAHDPDKDEVRRAVRFIRQKIDDANQPDVVQQQPAETEPDPLEQIEKLQELKDAGAISEAEFEEKKQDLLDKI